MDKIIQKAEELTEEIKDYCRRTEKIARNYDLSDYALAGFILIEDAYKTMIDCNPYMDYTAEFDIIKKRSETLLKGLIAYKAEKELS